MQTKSRTAQLMDGVMCDMELMDSRERLVRW
jgi:hypothetical protein